MDPLPSGATVDALSLTVASAPDRKRPQQRLATGKTLRTRPGLRQIGIKGWKGVAVRFDRRNRSRLLKPRQPIELGLVRGLVLQFSSFNEGFPIQARSSSDPRTKSFGPSETFSKKWFRFSRLPCHSVNETRVGFTGLPSSRSAWASTV